MASKLRAGIIGSGDIGLRHVSGYLNCGRYEVVALADLSVEAMQDYDRRFGGCDSYHALGSDPDRREDVSHYTDARRMLDEERLDVVSVCVWNRGHANWTIAAAARTPKAVLCEKPMAENLGRAEEMLTACMRNEVKLAIGHQRRFLPAYTKAREMIADGAIGEVQLMQGLSGAGLLGWASHHFDMFRYILGDDDCEWVMDAVERSTDRFERATRIEDRAVGVFGFRGGARAVVLNDLTRNYY